MAGQPDRGGSLSMPDPEASAAQEELEAGGVSVQESVRQLRGRYGDRLSEEFYAYLLR